MAKEKNGQSTGLHVHKHLNFVIRMKDKNLMEDVEGVMFEYGQFLELNRPFLITDQPVDSEPLQLIVHRDEGIKGYIDGSEAFKVHTGRLQEDFEVAFHWLTLQETGEVHTAFSPKMVRERFIALLEPLMVLMEVEDDKGYSHSQRVARLFVRFSRFLGLKKESENLFQHYGMLHDIGKIGLEQLMLFSPTRLRNFEETGEDHTITGTIILATLEILNDFIPFVRSHHESYDGRGYPDGLGGESIPYWVRVLSIIDWYDEALNTVDSEYSTGLMSSTEALKQIQKEAGSRFDPEIAKRFVRFILLENSQ